MSKLFEIKSHLTGRLYRITAEEVKAFYEEHVLGAVDKFRDKVLRTMAGRGQRVTFPVVGTVLVELFNPDAGLTEVRMGPNLVVDAGRALVVDLIQGSGTVADYIAVGTDNTAAAAGNTALGAEIGTRVQGTLTQPTSTTDRAVSTFGAGNATGAIVETGRLNASVSGTLLARQVFSTVNKGASDSLQITYDITT